MTPSSILATNTNLISKEDFSQALKTNDVGKSDAGFDSSSSSEDFENMFTYH